MTRCSKDESSSSEEPPRVNIAGLSVLPLLGMSLEEGWTRIPELLGFRKDEATGEKPWTTEPLRINPSEEETEVSELRCSLCRAVSAVALVVAEKHESVEFWRLSRGTEGSACSGSGEGEGCWEELGRAVRLASREGDSGPKAAFSCMLTTIRSKV